VQKPTIYFMCKEAMFIKYVVMIFCLTGAIYAQRSFSVCEMLETFTDTTFAADGTVRESWLFGEGREFFNNGLKYICTSS